MKMRGNIMSLTVETAETNAAWSVHQVEVLFELPLIDLLYRAQLVHRAHFDPNAIQTSTLLSIKTGGCSEDCGYCAQSKRHEEAMRRTKTTPVPGRREIKLEVSRDGELMSV